MPRHAPSALAAWTTLALPLLLVVAALYLCLGNESAVAAYFSDWRAANPQAARIVKFYTNWGNMALYLVYAAILAQGLLRRRADLTGRVLAYLAAQFLFSLALERLLKTGIGRPRPDVGGPFLPWSLDNAHHSMPSGHTGEMTVQTGCLAFSARSLALPAALGLVLAAMGASRVITGAHHPSDLLGGLVLGSLGALFARRCAPRLTLALTQRFGRFFANNGSR